MKRMSLMLAMAGMLAAGLANVASAADATQDLLKSKNCMGCHDIDKKKVGPSFKDTALKYKDDKGAEAKLVTQLKEGQGHPVKIVATDAELKTMSKYVLSQK